MFAERLTTSVVHSRRAALFGSTQPIQWQLYSATNRLIPFDLEFLRRDAGQSVDATAHASFSVCRSLRQPIRSYERAHFCVFETGPLPVPRVNETLD
jgi:hypothetical protein